MAEFSLDEIMEVVSHRDVPILILDERYNIVMPDKEKTPKIRKLEAKVAALLKRQGKVNDDLKELKRLKQKIMQSVVDNMDVSEEGDKAHQAKMNKAQQLIQEAKTKIEILEDQKLDIPSELKSANLELLKEFVRINYERLNGNREDIEILDKWINETRIELKKRLLIKQEKELKNNNIYAYMHDILGQDLIDIFDKADGQV